jgi:hypothetical protein
MIFGEGNVVLVGAAGSVSHMPVRAGGAAAVRLVPARTPVRFSHLPAHDLESSL